tara:strand:+ start:331 stop:672 length:342 start_codon:yes stop_codon:yes gene_type:complete
MTTCDRVNLVISRSEREISAHLNETTREYVWRYPDLTSLTRHEKGSHMRDLVNLRVDPINPMRPESITQGLVEIRRHLDLESRPLYADTHRSRAHDHCPASRHLHNVVRELAG